LNLFIPIWGRIAPVPAILYTFIKTSKQKQKIGSKFNFYIKSEKRTTFLIILLIIKKVRV